MKKLLVPIMLVMLLTGCGGGGSKSGGSTVASSITTLLGGDFYRISDRDSDGVSTIYHAITNNVVVTTGNDFCESDSCNARLITATMPYYYNGEYTTYTIGGLYGSENNAYGIIVVGPEYTGPPTGNLVSSYSGSAILVDTSTHEAENGSIRMNANFGTGSGTITGNAPSGAMSGNLDINILNGSFKGMGVSVRYTSDNSTESISLYGSFHDRAQGATGVFKPSRHSSWVGAFAVSQ